MNNEKWQKYLRINQEDFSASCEVDEGTRSLHKDLMNLLPIGVNILDIGCGTGWSTEELSKKYNFAIGISIQKEEIEYARQHHNTNTTHFCLEDMHDLSFSNKFFDTVYMRECLEHSIAPFIALCEVNRVLKIDGYFLVNTPSQDWVDWHCHYIVPTEQQMSSLLTKTYFKVIKRDITLGGHIYFLCQKIKDVEL